MTKKQSSPKSGIAKGYLHGYTHEEQDRLYHQARMLEPFIYEKVNFGANRKLLEVGCGVGAQTKILLERFPELKIQGVDSSKTQIARASEHLAQEIKEGRVSFEIGDALKLSYPDNSFDSAFICFLLEHVKNPVDILREVFRTLETGAIIYCTEVLNSTFYVHPYSPATLKYWFEFNDHQWKLGGDPFVGAKLGNYLLEAGFQGVTTEVKTIFCDNRAPKKRAVMIDFWTKLLLSGAPGMIAAGKITAELAEAMATELSQLKYDPDAVFYYSVVQARAQAF